MFSKPKYYWWGNAPGKCRMRRPLDKDRATLQQLGTRWIFNCGLVSCKNAWRIWEFSWKVVSKMESKHNIFFKCTWWKCRLRFHECLCFLWIFALINQFSLLHDTLCTTTSKFEPVMYSDLLLFYLELPSPFNILFHNLKHKEDSIHPSIHDFHTLQGRVTCVIQRLEMTCHFRR